MTKRRRKKHKPEEIAAKLCDADAMLNAGKELAVALQAREVSVATLERVGMETLYIEPGSPWEIGCAERFHRRFRDEFLAMEIFNSVRDAQALTATWRDAYSTKRPHSSLDYLPPVEFAASGAASTSAKASASAAHAGYLGLPRFYPLLSPCTENQPVACSESNSIVVIDAESVACV